MSLRDFALLFALASLPLAASALPISNLSQPARLAAWATTHGSHELEREDALDAKRAAQSKGAAQAKFGAASQWAVAAPSPVARHGGASAVVNAKIYVFGGYRSNFVPQTDSHVYDPATNAWTPIAGMPDAVTHAQAAVIGTKIYLGGGELGDGSQQQRVLLSSVYTYNTANNSWSTTEIPAMPQARSSGGFVALGTELHYLAGTSAATTPGGLDADVGDHFVYDTANPGAGWVTRAPLPDPRNHFQAIAHQGRIYAIGGQKFHNIPADGSVSYIYLKTNYAYTPGTNSWAQIADLEIPISELERASFTFNDKIVIGGGVTDGSQPLDRSYAFAPPSAGKPLGEWIRWPTLPAKRRSPIMQRVNERVIYGTGGGDFDGLRPETAMWTNRIRSDSPRVLFVRGADNTGGFGVANADTEHLSSVDDHDAGSEGNYGWGQLRGLLESEGFVVEQVVEPIVGGLEARNLPQYSVVVMGSNNAIYAPASVDALDAFIRARGGVLFIGDMRFGSTAAAAANSDNFFLTRFGLSMHQGLGTYELTRTPDFLQPTHPVWLGIDAVKGLPATFGDVVSPVRIDSVRAEVTLEVLARAEGNIQDIAGTVRPADANDVATVAGTVQGGRFIVFYDRDAFVNEKLTTSATSIVAADNLDLAVNMFDWLAARRDGLLLSDGFEEPVP